MRDGTAKVGPVHVRGCTRIHELCFFLSGRATGSGLCQLSLLRSYGVVDQSLFFDVCCWVAEAYQAFRPNPDFWPGVASCM